MNINKEIAGYCYICHAPCYRGDGASKWYFHESVGCVCRHHHGVEEWYQKLLKETFGTNIG